MTNNIGINIAKRRHALHMTQEQLAEASNLSVNYVSRLERGTSPRISAIMLYQIAKALNLSIEALLVSPTQSPHKIPGPKQARLNQYVSTVELANSEQLCQQALDLITQYHN